VDLSATAISVSGSAKMVEHVSTLTSVTTMRTIHAVTAFARILMETIPVHAMSGTSLMMRPVGITTNALLMECAKMEIVKTPKGRSSATVHMVSSKLQMVPNVSTNASAFVLLATMIRVVEMHSNNQRQWPNVAVNVKMAAGFMKMNVKHVRALMKKNLINFAPRDAERHHRLTDIVKVIHSFTILYHTIFYYILDINECDLMDNICINGTCINTDGSFMCECGKGLHLDSDGYTCVGK